MASFDRPTRLCPPTAYPGNTAAERFINGNGTRFPTKIAQKVGFWGNFVPRANHQPFALAKHCSPALQYRFGLGWSSSTPPGVSDSNTVRGSRGCRGARHAHLLLCRVGTQADLLDEIVQASWLVRSLDASQGLRHDLLHAHAALFSPDPPTKFCSSFPCVVFSCRSPPCSLFLPFKSSTEWPRLGSSLAPILQQPQRCGCYLAVVLPPRP